jgi:hypothetical protein
MTWFHNSFIRIGRPCAMTRLLARADVGEYGDGDDDQRAVSSYSLISAPSCGLERLRCVTKLWCLDRRRQQIAASPAKLKSSYCACLSAAAAPASTLIISSLSDSSSAPAAAGAADAATGLIAHLQHQLLTVCNSQLLASSTIVVLPYCHTDVAARHCTQTCDSFKWRALQMLVILNMRVRVMSSTLHALCC